MYSLTPFTFFCHNLLFPIYKAGFSLTFCLSSFFLLVFEPSYPQQSCPPSVSLHLLSGCIPSVHCRRFLLHPSLMIPFPLRFDAFLPSCRAGLCVSGCC